MKPFLPCLSTAEKKEAVRPPPFSNIIFTSSLPSIMSKGAIGLCHTMGIFLLLYSSAAVVGRFNQFSSQFLLHRFFPATPRRLDQPTHAERNASLRSHFNR